MFRRHAVDDATANDLVYDIIKYVVINPVFILENTINKRANFIVTV